jgi:Tfp pilus assembly protein PilN
MINLLPNEVKKNYAYARKNVSLRRWAIMFVFAFVGLMAIATYGLLDIQQSVSRYNKTVVTSEAMLQKENYTETQNKIKDTSGSFQLAVKVLEQEILFSKLIKQIGSSIPSNANLTGLNINQSQGAIDISAIATDYNTATQIQVNLDDPANKIFSKADIISITCNKDSASDPKYPCSVNVRALFSKDNPFLFINSKAKR